MRTPERTRRSLSQGDDTPRPSGTFQSVPSSHDAASAEQHGHQTKRLGFLGDKLLASAAAAAAGPSASLRGTPSQLSSRSHSRADSANLLPRDTPAASPAPMAASASHAKTHASPSKVRGLITHGPLRAVAATIEACGTDDTDVVPLASGVISFAAHL